MVCAVWCLPRPKTCGYFYSWESKTRAERAYAWTFNRLENWYFRPPPVRKFYASQAKAKQHKYKRYWQYLFFDDMAIEFYNNRPHNNADEDFLIKTKKRIEEIALLSNDTRGKITPMRV